jgi:hypothetical protein
MILSVKHNTSNDKFYALIILGTFFSERKTLLISFSAPLDRDRIIFLDDIILNCRPDRLYSHKRMDRNIF